MHTKLSVYPENNLGDSQLQGLRHNEKVHGINKGDKQRG